MKPRSNNGGFTFFELIMAVGVLVIALTALLSVFVGSLELIETTKNSDLALNAEIKVLEEMRRSSFSDLYSTYNGYTFSVSGMDVNSNLGLVSIDNSDPKCLRVDIGVCWMQKSKRIFGEGRLVSGAMVFSDNNGNGVLDSPVMLTTYMAQR